MQSLMVSGPLPLPRDQRSLIAHAVARRGSRVVVSAHGGEDVDRDGHGSGRMVDEDMITLRLRVKEQSLKELPPDWMEWERGYFGYFQKDVYALVGLLQTLLMNTRPSLALGMVAFLAITLTTSVGLSLFHVLHAIKCNILN